MPKCIDGNKAVQICISNCEYPNPFICKDCNKNKCQSIHQYCKLADWNTFKFKVESIEKQIDSQLTNLSFLIEQTIYKLKYLSQELEHLLKERSSQEMQSKAVNLFKYVRENQESKLTGKQVTKILQNIKFEKQRIKENEVQTRNLLKEALNHLELLEEMWKKMQQDISRGDFFIVKPNINMQSLDTPICKPEIKLFYKNNTDQEPVEETPKPTIKLLQKNMIQQEPKQTPKANIKLSEPVEETPKPTIKLLQKNMIQEPKQTPKANIKLSEPVEETPKPTIKLLQKNMIQEPKQTPKANIKLSEPVEETPKPTIKPNMKKTDIDKTQKHHTHKTTKKIQINSIEKQLVYSMKLEERFLIDSNAKLKNLKEKPIHLELKGYFWIKCSRKNFYSDQCNNQYYRDRIRKIIVRSKQLLTQYVNNLIIISVHKNLIEFRRILIDDNNRVDLYDQLGSISQKYLRWQLSDLFYLRCQIWFLFQLKQFSELLYSPDLRELRTVDLYFPFKLGKYYIKQQQLISKALAKLPSLQFVQIFADTIQSLDGFKGIKNKVKIEQAKHWVREQK